MKPLLGAGLLLVWLSVWLTGIAWVTRYRRARAYGVSQRPGGGYRADKDVALRLLVFLLGVGLLAAIYLVSRMAGAL